MKAWLETTGVAGQRLRFPLDHGRLRIGSVGTADVWIPMPGIRRQHCRVEPDGAVWRLVPLGGVSVRLNGSEVSEPSPLAVGDRLRIGPVELAVRDATVEIDVDAPAAVAGRRDPGAAEPDGHVPGAGGGRVAPGAPGRDTASSGMAAGG